MTTNRIQRTVRLWVLSSFLALVAFSFLAFGSASAHTLHTLHTLTRSTDIAQTASSSTTTVAKIVTSRGRAVFSPGTITVTSGTSVKIVNKTSYSRILFTNQGVLGLASGASMTMVVTQSQFVRICGGGSLTITVS